MRRWPLSCFASLTTTYALSSERGPKQKAQLGRSPAIVALRCATSLVFEGGEKPNDNGSVSFISCLNKMISDSEWRKELPESMASKSEMTLPLF
jgi:hypothetical protein